MEHIMKLQQGSFESMRSGQKIIEIRLYDEKRREVMLGDIIVFKRQPEQTEIVRAEVTGLLRYRTFIDLANDFPASCFGHANKENLLKFIYAFYTKEQEQQYGVLGIRIRVTI